jgi:hypothetical protein
MDRPVEANLVVPGGPVANDHRVVLVGEADPEDAVCATLAGDRWNRAHLRSAAMDPGAIRLHGRWA